ncbi:MAG TPA: hypothetical protein VF059_14315 [Casimicrobiaceae bacterium]
MNTMLDASTVAVRTHRAAAGPHGATQGAAPMAVTSDGDGVIEMIADDPDAKRAIAPGQDA